MPKRIMWNCMAFALAAIADLAIGPGRAAAQFPNPIQAAKDAYNKKQEQQKQKQQGQQQPGAPPPTSAGAAASAGAVSAGKVKIEQTVLAAVHQGDTFVVSPHGVHVMTKSHSGSRAVMIYDGVEGPKFDRILNETAFSPDGNHYAYCGQLGDEVVAMVDGKELLRGALSEGTQIASNGDCILGFTSNNKHVYYLKQVRKAANDPSPQSQFMFDGKAAGPVGAPPNIQEYSFSPDGDHFAYVWTDPVNPRHQILIVDGQQAPYLAGTPQWSADSQHLFTQRTVGPLTEALVDGKAFLRADGITLYFPSAGNMVIGVVYQARPPSYFLVVGNKKIPGSDAAGIAKVVFSPDGKHFAAICTTQSNRYFVLTDGKKGLEYQVVGRGQGYIGFTADSSNVVYEASNAGTNFLVVGEQESDGFGNFSGPVISQTGHRVGGITTTPPYSIILDGKTIPTNARSLKQLSFSPDGSRYAYVADQHLFLDGVPQPGSNYVPDSVAPDGSIGPPSVVGYVFSPDSKHVAHVNGPTTIYLDGKQLPTESTIITEHLTFTPDGSHLLWTIRSGPGFRIFVDGRPVLDGFYPFGFTFEKTWWERGSDGTLTVLAQIDNALKRVRITP